MATPYEAYREELDALTFTDEQKERLVERVRLAASVEGDVSGRGRVRPFAPRRRRSWVGRVAAVAVAVAVGLGCARAAATGDLAVVLGLIGDVFTGAPVPVQVADRVGVPVGARVSSDGVTVTAEAILGDRSNVVVVCSLEREGGWDLEALRGDDGLPSLAFTGGGSFTVDGISSSGGCAYFYDDDPADDTVRYVMVLSADTFDGGSVAGRTARLSLRDLSVVSFDGTRTVIAKGPWDLKFTVGYGDGTVELPCGQTVRLQGGEEAVVDELLLSPVGLTVRLIVDGGEVAPADARIPVAVTLGDGTRLDLDPSASVATVAPGVTAIRLSAVFDRIVDVTDVASVSVGDCSVAVGD